MLCRLFGAVVVSLTLLGCGFQPLYSSPLTSSSETPDDANVTAFFQDLEVAEINDRPGQILRGHLIRMLEQSGNPNNRRYELVVTLSETTTDLAVRKSAFASRANLTARATFYVRDRKARSSIFSSWAEMTSGYNIFSSEFQTLAAERGARERALEQLAQEIRGRLGPLYIQAIKDKQPS